MRFNPEKSSTNTFKNTSDIKKQNRIIMISINEHQQHDNNYNNIFRINITNLLDDEQYFMLLSQGKSSI